eukprot:TRINITY_DN13785_c0_g1_i1.p1 TRINITY_DN13785_c0_g1~~TRINITY_DN13785_c0_g1_i1.p1  ORF type:complete len:239 (-),score=55.42 TRINITY_DN13785_c0_g1_i1:56-730(-)
MEDWKQNTNASLQHQGAEACVYFATFLDKPVVIKERFSKAYRHPQLDEKLNTHRLKEEARFLLKARQAGVDTPTLHFVDSKNKLLYMERIDGLTTKKVINSLTGVEEKAAELHSTLEKIGTVVAQLHDAGIIHGDLTTSNILIRSQNNQPVVIDFGLSFVSHTSEDKAVDLYVLERAFGSTHPELEAQFPEILKFYASKSKNGADVLKRLEQVRMRGRKKLAFG